MKRAGTDMTRFTISVPISLLEALDERLTGDGESRSAVIRRLLEEALRRTEVRAAVAQYIEGYRAQPQTEAEFGWSDEAAHQHLAEVPWT